MRGPEGREADGPSHRRGRLLGLVLCIGVAGHPMDAAAFDANAYCDLMRGPGGTVVEVVDGDTVVLDDGSEVRLVGIQAPKLPLGRANFTTWPLADEAKAVLEDLVLGQPVSLRFGGRRADRHGRRLAHLFTGAERPVWVQAEMLSRGFARAYSFADNRSCVRQLQEVEQAARGARRGIWTDPFYAVRAADDVRALEALESTFQLVEGRVHDVAIVRGRAYLNFDDNFRQDFTVSISPGDLRSFPERGASLRSLEGKTIRVRGWIARLNGPMIEVSHPEQIERLGGSERSESGTYERAG